MSKSFIKLVIAASLLMPAASLLDGCATIREFLGFGYTQPTVTLKAIKIKNVTLDAIDIDVLLRVKNPNSFDIVMKRMDYNIIISTLKVAEGVQDKTVDIKEEKETDVRLPLRLDKGNIINIVTKYLEKPSQDLIAILNAKVTFESPLGEIEHTFTDQKKISP